MSSIEVKVPNVGVDGEVEVVEVCVSAGDQLEHDSPLIVLESDKATVEVPSPCSGKVESVAIKVGDKVQEGSLVLTMEASASEPAAEANEPEVTEENAVEEGERSLPVQAEVQQKGVVVPDLGGSEQVEVIEVLVSEGSQVESEQTLIVLESDKATMEIPSSETGVLKALKVKVGDKVSSGDLIAEVDVMSSPNESAATNENELTNNLPDVERADAVSLPATESRAEAVPAHRNEGLIHAGPAVRKFAREHGVELSRVSGSGPHGRILKEDLRVYIKSQVVLAQGGSHSAAGLPEVSLPDFSAYGEIELRSLSKMQLLTARNMQTSWLTVPHVTQFDEADITDLEVFRKSHKAQAESRGVKLTPVAFVIKACAYALASLPQFNVSIDMKNEQLVQKKYIHIGLAVDTPAGLVVPVIKDVDKKSIWDIAEECQSLAIRAKDRKLSPTDMQGACFTISSLGGVGGTAFTPIVNTPEVAILGLSKSQIKPVWNEDQEFVPRLMLPLSLSYDHRAVNGADAARFTTLLSQVLADLRELLL